MSGTGPIWRDGAFGEEGWVHLAADAALPASGEPLLVPLAAFFADSERFAGYNGPLGIEIGAGEAFEALVPHLPRLALIALAFPKFSDGRNYSTARLLRERHGYRGELRAFGEVLSDQVPLMRRCGIDSFEVHHAPTRKALASGRLAEVKHYYQPLSQGSEIPVGTRSWLRLPTT